MAALVKAYGDSRRVWVADSFQGVLNKQQQEPSAGCLTRIGRAGVDKGCMPTLVGGQSRDVCFSSHFLQGFPHKFTDVDSSLNCKLCWICRDSHDKKK